ncbi:MAG: O-antigen ligase family protein [Nitrospirae bacterium]|nr:O-antigen ligase family protein [Nitrospirota bacterium]
MTLIKVVGILTVIYAIYRHMQGLKNGFWPPERTKFWFFCFFAGLFTIHFSGKVISDWAVHVALFYVVMVLVDSLEVIIKSFFVTIAAMLVNCIQSWKGLYIYSYYARPTGSFDDANYFALGLIVSIGMAACLYKLYPKYKIFFSVSMLMLFFTLMLTASRGGILGLGIMTMLFLLKLKKPQKVIFYSALLSIITTVIIINFAPDVAVRFKGEDHSTASSTENRKNMLITGINMVKENKLTGIGYGNFKPMAREYNPELTDTVFVAHNSYLSVAAELGLPMLAAFLILLGSVYFSIRKFIRLTKENERMLTVLNTIQIVFVGYCCSIAFLTAEREKYLWLLILFIMALGKLVRTEQSKKREQQEYVLTGA